MALKVISGKIQRAYIWFLYGVEGIGKTTFGAESDSPVFADIESGSAKQDVARLVFSDGTTRPSCLSDFVETIKEFVRDPGPYKTLVIDSIDALEALVHREVCLKNDKVDSIEKVGGGYGKGYTYAVEEWRRIINILTSARDRSGINTIVLGHAQIKRFANPEGPDFERYEAKLAAKAAALIKEISDSVFFVNYEIQTTKESNSKLAKSKGVPTTARLLYTQRSIAFDAKTRDSLPPVLPLSFSSVVKAMSDKQPADPVKLTAAIREMALTLVPATREEVNTLLAKAGTDSILLSRLHSWVLAKVAQGATIEPTGGATVTEGLVQDALDDPRPRLAHDAVMDETLAVIDKIASELSPGVDVPAMAAGEDAALAEIQDAFDLCRSTLDLDKVTQLIVVKYKGVLSPASIGELRAQHASLNESLKGKASAK